jgi:hypothetical protein
LPQLNVQSIKLGPNLRSPEVPHVDTVVAVVIGQILAGLLLGPSLLGRLPGHLTGRVFPHQVLHYLTVLTKVAVLLFTFSVGYEIRTPADA